MRKIIALIVLSIVGINVYSQTPIPGHAGSISNGDNGALLDRPWSVFVSGNYAYIASNNSDALEIIDINNSAAPVHIGSISDGEDGALLNNPVSVHVSGNYAYIASIGSNALEIVDVSDPTSPVHAGSISHGDGGALLNGLYSVFVSGNYVYVASTSSNALEIVDVSDPTNPVHAGSISDGEGGAELNGAQSVYVIDNYAYVASISSNALEIIDITDPTSPIHKGSFSNGINGAILDGPTDVYVSGNYAYVTVGNPSPSGLVIVNIADPSNPVHAGSIYSGGGGAAIAQPQAVFVSGDYAYVASAGTQKVIEIVNISDPSNPVHSASIFDGDGGALLNGAYSVFISDSYAYVASSSSDALEIVDISDPTTPVHESSIIDGEGSSLLDAPYSTYVSGNFAYIASYTSNALEIVDISSPSNPVHAGSLSHGEGGALLLNPFSVYVSGNYAYVASFGSNALEIVDISDPTAPEHAGSITDGTQLLNPSSVFVSGNYAYVTIFGDALEIVDVTDPTTPVHAGIISDGSGGALINAPWSVFVSGNYAYLASAGNGALEVVDVTDPTTPVHAGSISNGEGGAILLDTYSVYVSGNYAYVVSGGAQSTLEIVDISDPTTPVHAGNIADGDGGALLNLPYSVDVSGNYAYVASRSSGALEIVDISDPTTPVHENSISNGEGGALLGSPQSVFVSGNYAYVASTGSSALEIVAIFTPIIPTAVTATSINQTSFTANCNTVSNANSGYYLDVSTDNFATFVMEGILGTESVSVTSLNSATTYQYRFRAVNANGASSFSNVIQVLTLPADPIASVASSISQIGFTANWDAVTGADDYYLEVSINTDLSAPISGFDGTVAIDAANTNEVITGLSSGITYYYRVTAENATGKSGVSNVISQITIPATPTAVTATSVMSTSFDANWNAVTGVDDYYLEVSTNADLTSPIAGYDGTVAIDGANTSESISGLSAATTYYYRVTAENVAGKSGTSNVISQLILTANPTAIAATSMTQTSFIANWDAVTGADNYYLEVSENADLTSPIAGYDGTMAIDAANTSESITGLTSGIVYHYRVTAENATGKSGVSNVIPQITALVTPVTVSATSVTSNSMVANWNGVTGVANYYLEVSTNADLSSPLAGYDGTVGIDGANTFETVSGLNFGTTYYYRVTAENAAGQSGVSNITSQTTGIAFPKATGATSIGETSFVANWNAVIGATNYYLEVATNQEFSSHVTGFDGTVAINGASNASVTGLSTGSFYYYRVTAENSSGLSYPSNVISTNTLLSGGATMLPIPGHAGSISNGDGGALLSTAWSVHVSGSFAYVVGYDSDALEIVDISDPSAPQHVGSISDGKDGALLNYPTSVFVLGNYAYVTSQNDDALEIVDVSDPSAPEHAGSISNGEGGALLSDPVSVYVSGNYAYVASIYSEALEIIDVSNPASPVHAGSISMGSPTSVYISENYAYLTADGGLQIVDVSIPINPVFAGGTSNLEGANPSSVHVSGNYAYMVDGNRNELQILDISDPTSPFLVGSIADGDALLDNPRALFISGNYAYVTSEVSQALEIIDISNPTAPTHAGSLTSGIDVVRSIHVVGDYAYLAHVGGSLLIVDISNPFAPVQESSISEGEGGALLSNANSVYVSGDYAYVASYNSNALEILDISNPADPIHTSNISNGEGGALLLSPSSVFVLGNYAYVASFDSDALEIVDVTDPTAPVHTGSIAHGSGGASLKWASSVFVSGNYAYVTSYIEGTLEIVDVTNPAAPVHAGVIQPALSDAPNSVYVSGNYAYVAVENSNALEIVDVTDPTTPVHAGSIIDGSGGALLKNPVSVYVSGNYAYLTSQTGDALEIVDVTDPTTPVHAGSVTHGSGGALLIEPVSVYVSDNYVYVASLNSNALEIIDISNPASPFHAGSISNGSDGTLLEGPRSVHVLGNYAYVVSFNSLEIVSIFTPTTPIAISATSVTGTSFIANCEYIPNATSGYFLDVSSDNFSTFVSGYENLAGAQSISVTGLSPVTTYQYRFRAVNPNGTSGNSNVITVATTPPAPVATDATNVSTTGFTANWEAVAGVDSYYLEVATNAAFGSYVSGFSGTTAIDASVTSQSITGLSAGIEYHYRVSAEIASTRSVPSNVKSVFTASGTIAILSTTNVSETSFTINWESLSGATNYFITISTNSDLSAPIAGYDGTTALAASQTSETVNGLSSGTLYHYQITASTSGGSDAISAIETELTYPSAPTANAATDVMSNSFVANWSTVTGADSYYLQVSVNNSFSSFLAGYNGTVAMSSTTTTETVSGLAAGTTYFYRVIAENTTGQSDPSNSIDVTTLLNSPVATSATSIGDISFVANWEVVTGANEYELDISTDEFTTLIEGYNPKVISTTQELVNGLIPETIYSYRVRAKNPSGVSDNSNTITATTLQAGTGGTSLNLADINYSNTQDNTTTQTLNISVSGGTPPYVVVFKHKGILDDAFTEVTLTEVSSSNYTVDVTPNLFDELGAEFEVTVTDGVNSEVSQSGVINLEFVTSGSPQLPFESFGGTDITWNLFTIPYDLDDKSVSNIFSNFDPARHEFDWKIMRYRNNSNDYVNFNTGQVKIGEAYWFNAKKSATVNVGAGSTTAEIPFTMSLSQGWNLIGNPYPTGISWEKVLTDNSTVTGVGSLQIFKALEQTTGDVMSPFSGGFVWSDAATSVEIDPVTAKSNSGGRLEGKGSRIEGSNIDDQEWQLSLEFQNGVEKQLVGGFGIHPDASTSKDSFDDMMVPRFVRYTDLYTMHDDYFYPKFATDIVPSNTTHNWSFTLSSNKEQGLSELVWDNEALASSLSKLYLLDLSSGVVVDMSTQNSHGVNLDNGDFKFEIYFVANGEQFLPHQLILGDAFPNPVKSVTTIPIIIPEEAGENRMTLKVYDINGREVTTLADGIFAPGGYMFSWNLSQQQEINTNGLYFYRLTFDNENTAPIQKKIIIQR